MTTNTINDSLTIAGNSEGTLLANRYRVVRQLGQGGMGSVWLAEDTQLDNKPFAIKMLPAILVANKRAYLQLKDEALVAMKLTHPNIVTLRAFEENNGNPFLVMDYIDGQTLDDYLAEKGKLSEGEVIRVLRPIAAALDYAHGEGVIHRDVKPANVMIRKDGHPFILDFGIAREIQETMTRVTGKLSSGTLLYMSPEQLNGERPTPAQDIYSFAAMVYECLKGEPPFSRGQIEHQILNNPPPPLDIPTDGPSAWGSGTLAASVMAGLAKKPEERPATCAAVLDGNDFSRVEHVERVESGNGRARSPSVPQPGGLHSRATIAILAVALLAIVGGVWWTLSRTGSLPVLETPPPSRMGGTPVQPDGTATAKHGEALSWNVKIEPILAAEAFKTCKDDLTNSFVQAEVLWNAGLWSEAAGLYEQYVKKCEELNGLHGEWLSAVQMHENAQKAMDEAKRTKDEASKIEDSKSVDRIWNSADALMKESDKTFDDESSRMRFVTASNTYVLATRQFKACTHEAQSVLANAVMKVRQESERLQKEVDGILKHVKHDEFKGCKKNLARSFEKAEALWNTNQWFEAFMQFTDYTNQCTKLIVVNDKWKDADVARKKAEDAKRDAENAGVTVEIQAWTKATNLWQDAVTQISEGNVDASGRAFDEAAVQFGEVNEMYNQKVMTVITAERKRRKAAEEAKLQAEEAERQRAAEAEAKRQAEEAERQRAAAAEARAKAEQERVFVGHKGIQLWEGGPYWAETNIDAAKPEDYGYYFWWGDTVGYKWENGAWVASNGSKSGFSFKGDNTPTYRKSDDVLKNEGWVTEEDVFASEHDAAHVKWGGGWRMPTKQELDDLESKCNWEWTTLNGVKGYKIRGKGAYASVSIFLPSASSGSFGTSLNTFVSYGYYWSSVPGSGIDYAWGLFFYSGGHSTGNYDRRYWFSVRPVHGVIK